MLLPVLFIGHGNPMNALETNAFTNFLTELGKQIIPKPKAILVVSAHWLTRGSHVSAGSQPELIYDFFGFPDSLYHVEYPCAGDPNLAASVISHIPWVQANAKRGIDHGAWTILKHLYPKADIPVVQLSIDLRRPMNFHFELGEQLGYLRQEGVLIIGSGNIVHNLMNIDFNQNSIPYPWAVEFDHYVKHKLDESDFEGLMDYEKAGEVAKLAVPTTDHYLPLIYCLGATYSNESIESVYEEIVHGSISMRCIRFG